MNNEKLDRFSEKLLDFMTPFINVMSTPFAQSLQEGFMSLIPIIFIGSISLLIYMGTFPGGYVDGVTIFPFLAPIADKIILIQAMTLGICALFVAIFVSINYGRRLNLDPANSAVIGLVGFLFASYGDASTMLSADMLSPVAMFTAVLTSFVSIRVMKFCYDKNIVIKMPDGVPPAVSATFSAFIPYVFVVLIFWTFTSILHINVNDAIAAIIRPILKGGDTMISHCVYYLITDGIGFFGLHGENIVSPIYSPLMTAWTLENTEAFLAGQELPHIWTTYFQRMGSFVAPLLVMCWRSKVPQYRQIAKVSLLPGLFNVWEPLCYGIPLNMNAIFFIPGILTHIVSTIVLRTLTMIGFVPRMHLDLPFCLPIVIGLPLATGSLMALVAYAIDFAIHYLMYYPFFKIAEKEELKKLADRGYSVE